MPKYNPAPQDSPPAAAHEATNSVPPQCDPRGALFAFQEMRRNFLSSKKSEPLCVQQVARSRKDGLKYLVDFDCFGLGVLKFFALITMLSRCEIVTF